MNFKNAELKKAYDVLVSANFIVDECINMGQQVTKLVVYPNNNPKNGWIDITCWASEFSAVSSQEQFKIDAANSVAYANADGLVKALKKIAN